MKLTVDAGIVVKWFIAEPLCEESRLAIGRRAEFFAPEIVLAEFANTVWKKVRRKELPDPESLLAELATLPVIVDLRTMHDLAGRAARIAFQIDHPVYDCLYLACAEVTDSELVTADERFVRRLADRLPDARVHYIGAPGVADRLAKAVVEPVIRKATIEELIALHDTFEETEKSVIDAHFGEKRGPRILSSAHEELFRDSLPYGRLVDSVDQLGVEERIDLLALGWLGAGLYPDWRRSFAHAEETVEHVEPSYAARYGHHWRTGYAYLTDT